MSIARLSRLPPSLASVARRSYSSTTLRRVCLTTSRRRGWSRCGARWTGLTRPSYGSTRTSCSLTLFDKFFWGGVGVLFVSSLQTPGIINFIILVFFVILGIIRLLLLLIVIALTILISAASYVSYSVYKREMLSLKAVCFVLFWLPPPRKGHYLFY